MRNRELAAVELATISAVAKLASWFQADPRRICVLGVWLYLAGCGLTFYFLVAGAPAAGLVFGVALALAGARAKVIGRERFKHRRSSRRSVQDRDAGQPARAL